MLTLRNIGKSYDGVQVLSDISLEFPACKTHALIGPSGCGKSTLLRTIMGLVIPDQGSVHFGKRLLVDSESNRKSQNRDWKKDFGYVIQSGGLFPHLTARENVLLPFETHPDVAPANIEAIDNRLRELAELTHFPADGLTRYPSQLSGGQRQRVSLMRALALDPEVLLLDEPLGALDPMIRAELQIELRTIFAELAKTVVLVTHDLHEAQILSHEATLLNLGRIEQRGTITDFVENPESDFVSRFVSAQAAGLSPQ